MADRTASDVASGGPVGLGRIRELRVARNLSQRDLATRAGISPALVSQVERGVTDPSLETLRRLARALDTPIFGLLQADDVRTVSLVRRADRMRVSSPHGGIVYSRISAASRRMEMLEGVLQPGETTSREPMSHPAEECALVLSGEIVLEYGEERFTLTAGDSCTFDSQVPHRYRNLSDEPASLVMAVTPPSF
jgi:transcriptional regulator with XRE-family HTH domain